MVKAKEQKLDIAPLTSLLSFPSTKEEKLSSEEIEKRKKKQKMVNEELRRIIKETNISEPPEKN